ncbi:hypothetical protein [Spiroplasma culicicola]|uniref:Uncharacterized protein n=1 Tax=Spiroplasma culicicola AES-1 TaxID=1276246 RepID=W6A7M0_9MOLU|nr:hypothetical protein [Spiroplasma culicicola]AHI52982.1 hypothetical protein SCULI_v1c06410 [Spiroplasma culicicola AES-1]
MKTLLALLGGMSASIAPAGVILKEEINSLSTRDAAVELEMPDMTKGAYLELWEEEFQGLNSTVVDTTEVYSNPNYGFQLARDVKEQVNEDGEQAIRNLSTVQSYNLANKNGSDTVYQIQSKGNNIVKMHTLDNGQMVFDDVEDTAYFTYDAKTQTDNDKDYERTSIIQYINGNNEFVNRYVAGWSEEFSGNAQGSVKVFDGSEAKFLDLDFVIPTTMTGQNGTLNFNRFLNVFSNTKTNGSTMLYIAAHFSGSAENQIGIFSYDLTNKINKNTGEFSSDISGEIAVDNLVKTMEVSSYATQDFIFFTDPKGYTSFLYSGDVGTGTKMFTENTNNDENIKPFEKEIEFENSQNEGSRINSMITTQHRLRNPNNQDFVVFAANNSNTAAREGKLWYLDYDKNNPFKVESKELFNFNLFKGEDKDGIQDEKGKVTNLISYYDNIANEYKISLTTDKAIYSYIYKTPSDFASSTNSRAIKELIINTGMVQMKMPPANEAMFKITAGSLNYVNGEIVFLLGSGASEMASKTWYGSLYEKYDITDLSLSNQIVNFTPSDSANNVEENVEELKEQIINEFKSISGTVGMMFKQASSFEEAQQAPGQEDLWDYKVDIDDTLANTFFPTNQFGNIEETGKVSVLTNNTENGQWAAKFKGKNDRSVSVSYTNAYDLVNLVDHMNDLYETETIIADDFNHIVGQIYNNIGDHLNQVIHIKNQEYPIFSKNEIENSYWQISNWEGAGPERTEFDANNWGFFNGDDTVDENGYYTRTLDNINIKIGQKPELGYFKISDSENTYVDSNENKYITLKPITVKYKSVITGRANINDNEANLKLDMKQYANEAQKLQFDGRGFDVNSSREALQYMLNKNRKLGQGIGYAISVSQYDQSNLTKGSTTMKVYIYDKGFANPTDPKWYLDTNAEVVEILILGLTERDSLPAWIMPTLVLGGMSLLIMTILTAWFIGRKRFYKKAIGKEAAKVAIARMKEEKIKSKVGDK